MNPPAQIPSTDIARSGSRALATPADSIRCAICGGEYASNPAFGSMRRGRRL